MELVSGSRKPSELQAFKTMMGLEVCEAHLNLLSLIARFEVRLSLHLAARQVTSILVHIAYDPTGRHLGAAFWFKHTCPTVEQ